MLPSPPVPQQFLCSLSGTTFALLSKLLRRTGFPLLPLHIFSLLGSQLRCFLFLSQGSHSLPPRSRQQVPLAHLLHVTFHIAASLTFLKYQFDFIQNCSVTTTTLGNAYISSLISEYISVQKMPMLLLEERKIIPLCCYACFMSMSCLCHFILHCKCLLP